MWLVGKEHSWLTVTDWKFTFYKSLSMFRRGPLRPREWAFNPAVIDGSTKRQAETGALAEVNHSFDDADSSESLQSSSSENSSMPSSPFQCQNPCHPCFSLPDLLYSSHGAVNAEIEETTADGSTLSPLPCETFRNFPVLVQRPTEVVKCCSKWLLWGVIDAAYAVSYRRKTDVHKVDDSTYCFNSSSFLDPVVIDANGFSDKTNLPDHQICLNMFTANPVALDDQEKPEVAAQRASDNSFPLAGEVVESTNERNKLNLKIGTVNHREKKIYESLKALVQNASGFSNSW
ncbi:unnamed protein product [Soboliphyme baturini]|uniref:Uncharacterized protein n=1 Tax=Soboliphyme baturini TaxID=241478 RepID=A0A183IGR1_9BILA|nr:unnamed protein product [Soboliphyme baturini]